jgi:SAM-dependent methyltransferase
MARSGDDRAAPLAQDARVTTTHVTTLEPKMIALYESVLDELEIGVGDRLLDVRCGAGLFLRLAAQRGAAVTGIDAAAPLEALPYDDDSYTVVTGFNAFQSAADPARALGEAGRVAHRGAPIVIATWGPPEQCEAEGYVKALGALLPEAPGPFALAEPGALEAFARRGGLEPGERRDVLCVWTFADDEELLRALKSTGFALRAIESSGEEKVEETVLRATAPYRMSDGGYRLENVFPYVITHT